MYWTEMTYYWTCPVIPLIVKTVIVYKQFSLQIQPCKVSCVDSLSIFFSALLCFCSTPSNGKSAHLFHFIILHVFHRPLFLWASFLTKCEWSIHKSEMSETSKQNNIIIILGHTVYCLLSSCQFWKLVHGKNCMH